MTDIATICADPQWLPHRYHAAEGQVEFLYAEPAQMRAATFLADLDTVHPERRCRLSVAQVAGITDVPGGALHFVFHTAFCRSTLLTRALDIPGIAFGLSEPAILNDLSHAGREAFPILAPILSLLARPIEGAPIIVVKPSNVANNLLPALLSARPESRGLLLSGSLSAFLWSVHKKGLMGRSWTRRLYRRVSQFAPLDLGMDEAAMFELSDLQVAALAWLLQQRYFAMALGSRVGARLATLDSADLMDARLDALEGTGRHFGIALAREHWRDLAEGPVFARHAKLGGDFEGIVSLEDEAARSTVVQEEVAMVEQWIAAIAGQIGLTVPVRKPLFER